MPLARLKKKDAPAPVGTARKKRNGPPKNRPASIPVSTPKKHIKKHPEKTVTAVETTAGVDALYVQPDTGEILKTPPVTRSSGTIAGRVVELSAVEQKVCIDDGDQYGFKAARIGLARLCNVYPSDPLVSFNKKHVHIAVTTDKPIDDPLALAMDVRRSKGEIVAVMCVNWPRVEFVGKLDETGEWDEYLPNWDEDIRFSDPEYVEEYYRDMIGRAIAALLGDLDKDDIMHLATYKLLTKAIDGSCVSCSKDAKQPAVYCQKHYDEKFPIEG